MRSFPKGFLWDGASADFQYEEDYFLTIMKWMAH